jgi:hypothetical protein
VTAVVVVMENREESFSNVEMGEEDTITEVAAVVAIKKRDTDSEPLKGVFFILLLYPNIIKIYLEKLGEIFYAFIRSNRREKT